MVLNFNLKGSALRSLLLLVFLATALFGIEIVNGEVKIFHYPKDPPKTIGYNGEFTLPLIKHPQDRGYLAVLPINYRTTNSEATLTKLFDSGTKRYNITIKQGQYKQEQLRVDPSKVSPPKEQLPRIRQEYKEAMKIYNSTTDSRYWEKPFIYPLNSVITSDYGNARVFNESLQSFHSGTDFRAAIGTPIKATNDGVVVLAQDRYYAGKSVVLDHGHGIYSVYFHLSQIDVSVGDKLSRGEVLGLSGDTGRVTGPHLHFGIMVQGYAINPLHFIDTINSYLKES